MHHAKSDVAVCRGKLKNRYFLLVAICATGKDSDPDRSGLDHDIFYVWLCRKAPVLQCCYIFWLLAWTHLDVLYGSVIGNNGLSVTQTAASCQGVIKE